MDLTSQLKQFSELYDGGRKLNTLVPLLPTLFYLRGKPLTLQNHFVFEPFFATDVPRNMVARTGRQVGKTLSIAARGLGLSGIIPYYRNLFVAPLLDQAQRISNDHIRPLVEESPFRNVWFTSANTGSVMRRELRNQSVLYFSYCFLSSERLRGYSGLCNVNVDESARWDSLISMADGSTKQITNVEPGDMVLSFDCAGRLRHDTVVARPYHGRRRCFRVRCADGSHLDATSESWVATDAGWMRVSQIIEFYGADTGSNGKDARSSQTDARGINQPATSTPARYATRRRSVEMGHETSVLFQQPWLGSARVQLSQIPSIIRVYSHTSREASERRLRGVVERLQHIELSGIRLLRGPMLPGRPEVCNAGVVGRFGTRSFSLLATRRWKFGQREYNVSHRGFSERPGGFNQRVVQESWLRSQNVYCAQEENRESVLHCRLEHGRYQEARGSGEAVYSPVNGVQDSAACQTNCGLSYLQPAFPSSFLPEFEVWQSEAATDGMSGPRLSADKDNRRRAPTARGGSREISTCIGNTAGAPTCFTTPKTSQTSKTEKDTFLLTGTLLPEMRCSSDSERASRYGAQVLSVLPYRSYQDAEEGVPGQTELIASASDSPVYMPLVRKAVRETARTASRQQDLVFSRVPVSGYSGEEAETWCKTSEITSIEDLGEYDVYDLETAFYHTFFANGIGVHNCQDLDPDHLPVIAETMSSPAIEGWGTFVYTGTSKTRNGTLEWLWNSSSQAEWLIRCDCGQWNIPAAKDNGGHLERMIGPYREDISEERPGLICAYCSKPLQPRTGRWVHRRPELAKEFAGYHIPQMIMPGHYAKPAKWQLLLAKQRGGLGYTVGRFYNECAGEAYDLSTALINIPDLKKAAILHRNDEALGKEASKAYVRRILAVDWGGGGEEGVSFTTLAVLGMLPTGTIDVIWGRKLLTPHDHTAEAMECLRIFHEFNCEMLVHDYTGAGSLRETIMVHNGMPSEALMPISYIGATKGNVIGYKPPSPQHPRQYWQADKTRSLQLTVYAIKFGLVRFFEYDFISNEEPGLLHDFLALVENKVDTARGSDSYTIQRDPMSSDDFAQAVNLGCIALWHISNSWPSFDGPHSAE